MLSYRHAFHAGNHADVLKHCILVQLILYMQQKDTPFFYIDTHAGAGLYSLTGGYAQKSKEFETGIARLWGKNLSGVLGDYLNVIKKINRDGILNLYPGSPFIADILLRDSDKLRLYELHPNDVKILSDNFSARMKSGGRGKRIIISKKDGFAGLKEQLPPPARRALVFIDPPYEVKTDYRETVKALRDSIKRFSSGIYAVWYPVLQRNESKRFFNDLKRTVEKNWLNVTLSVSSLRNGLGLRESGMFIVNPPWTLRDNLEKIMPDMLSLLAQDNGADFCIETA